MKINKEAGDNKPANVVKHHRLTEAQKREIPYWFTKMDKVLYLTCMHNTIQHHQVPFATATSQRFYVKNFGQTTDT